MAFDDDQTKDLETINEDSVDFKFSIRIDKRWSVHYEPPPEEVKRIALYDEDFVPPASPILIIEGDVGCDIFKIYPIDLRASNFGFLRPKYDQIRSITFEKFGFSNCDSLEEVKNELSRLPSGFIKTLDFGLGLKWEYRYIVNSIEEIGDINDITLRRGRSTDLPACIGTSYITTARAFDDARKAINRVHSKALRLAAKEKNTYAHNLLLTTVDPAKFPLRHLPYQKDSIFHAIGNAERSALSLSRKDQETVLEVTKKSVKSLVRTKPDILLELSREIELVTLEELVQKLKQMLDSKLSEGAWQSFFSDNPFILRLAFEAPIIVIGEQVSVGGRRLNGSGEKIADFISKAVASGNLSLIEIKTATTPVLETKAYRGSLHAPSRELSGAVNQLLDQRYQLQKTLPALKDNSGI